MADFPAELSTGMVHGRFIVAVIDSEDEGQDPDVVPAQGKVAFKASVGYIPVPVATGGPVTVMKGPIMGALDDEGYLCTPHPVTGEPMYRGVRLIATDDPDMAVTDWTWNADYRLEAVNGNSMQIPAHSFALPSGAELDLTTLVKVPSSPGYGLPQAEAAVLRAEAAAQVALDVKAMADAGEFDGAQGLPGNATMRVDTSAGEAIYVTDGVTEKLVKYDSGLRDITAELKNGWTVGTSGYVRVRRQGNAVTYYIKNLSPAGATAVYFWTGIPDGFLPSTSGTYRQILASSATTFTVCSVRRFERDINIPTSAGTIGDQYSECAVTFQIIAPLPTTLPGTPA